MLMYPLGEAVLLLSEKLSTAKKNLNNIKEDLEFLREQVTVMEVNFARVHNVSLKDVSVVLLVWIWDADADQMKPTNGTGSGSVGCQAVSPDESASGCVGHKLMCRS